MFCCVNLNLNLKKITFQLYSLILQYFAAGSTRSRIAIFKPIFAINWIKL